MTDIINILIRCKFAYNVDFGFMYSWPLYYARCCKSQIVCMSKVGHLQLALVVGSKTKSTDVFNVLLD